ncbi:MAG: hypothetical protein ACE5EE_00225 [Fidelibacterota bacterium]
MKFLELTLIFTLSVTLLPGESIWIKYGNQAFKGAGDARTIALSESNSAVITGPFAALWNPSNLALEGRQTFVYAHQERFAGIVNFDVVAVNLKKYLDMNWSLVLIRQGVEGIPNTTQALYLGTGSLDNPDERILESEVTYFNQVQWAAVFGGGFKRGQWDLGSNLRLLNHRLGRYSGYGVGFDLSISRNFFRGNRSALILKDITTSWVVWDSGTVERIAPTIVLSDGQKLKLEKMNTDITLTTSVNLNLNGRNLTDDFTLGTIGAQYFGGVEIGYRDRVHLRLGRHPLTEFTLGVGLTFPFGGLDYAFSPSPGSSILGNSHHVALKLRLEYLHLLRERLLG